MVLAVVYVVMNFHIVIFAPQFHVYVFYVLLVIGYVLVYASILLQMIYRSFSLVCRCH